MHRVTGFVLLLFGILATIAARPAAAGILLHDNVGGGTAHLADLSTLGDFGALSRVDVGAADVAIEQFGTFGRSNTGGNIRFAIFDAPATTRLYLSAPIAVALTTELQWYDSPLLSLTLDASQMYWLGMIADHGFEIQIEGFVNLGDVAASAETEGGLTSPASNIAGANGRMQTFIDPVLDHLSGAAQVSLRVFGPGTAIPEPGPLALLGLGLAALGALRRHQLRAGRVAGGATPPGYVPR